MLTVVLVVIVCITLAMSVATGIYALFRSQSRKKNYFLLMQMAVITYLFGYLLELTSTNAEEAYAAVKILYLGGSFVAVFTFFFISDYCNIFISPFIKAAMLLLAAAEVITMWTTKFHRLVYSSYGFETIFFNHLDAEPGPLYPVINAYPGICLILTIVLLLYQVKKWKNKYRRQLLTILSCVAIPFVVEGIYILTTAMGINKYHIYLSPYSIAIMSLCLYLGVMRFNIFEIISIATVSAMEHIKEGFVLVDESSNYLSSNPAAQKIIPGITKLVKGESIFSAEGWPPELKKPESESIEFSIAETDTRHFTAGISPVLAQNNSLIARIIIIREITDSVNLMKELENAAYMDSLTGLYNRKHFFELANSEIERAERLNHSMYAAMLDLDFFKNVNDSYGHAAGDLILKTTAAVIRQTIRSYDLLGRYGGEEFVLLIADLDTGEAQNLMERIRENMEHRVTLYEETEIKITCSIGLAKFLEGDTMETSLKKADEALYTAKNSGRNKVKLYEPRDSRF